LAISKKPMPFPPKVIVRHYRVRSERERGRNLAVLSFLGKAA
jgi:hypothetical protein